MLMQDRPTLHELLQAVERFLEEEIVPNSRGRQQFLARVSANTIRMVDREIEHREEHFTREWQGLDALLGAEPMPGAGPARREALVRRTAELCEKIRSGEANGGEWGARVRAHLHQTVRDKLSVTDPGLLERDEGGS
jgi:hypothetical protein